MAAVSFWVVHQESSYVAEVLAELMNLIGGDVDVAYDGSSALAFARATPPDLVICDLGLPGVCNAIKVG
jgi:DNA-binding response OmpR family regulator